MMCSRCKKRIAVVFLSRMEGGETINEGLCLKCARELGIKPVNDLMDQMGVTEEDIDNVSGQLEEFMESGDYEELFSPGGAATFPFMADGNDLAEGEGGELVAAETETDEKETTGAGRSRNQKEKKKKRKFLDSYCDNLTQKARDEKLDHIVGRDKEIYRVVQILSRRTKNNPCLIGEPGVGKTAIAEGIALRIVSGDVPARLMNKEIYLLDLTALVAGTQFRGQFESRVKGLIDEVKADGNVILFIDEIHNLVGAGDSEGSMNAGNIMKPALSRGEIQVIGATTFNEYRKYIEKDSALERRFQPVTVEEPSIADTVEVLRGIKGYYEAYHKVKMPDDMVFKAVSMSERYINDRFLPDKAIDLMDEACSHASLESKELAAHDKLMKKLYDLTKEEEELEADPNHIDYEKAAKVKSEIIQVKEKAKALEPALNALAVTDDDLAKVVELWTGIPASKVKEDEFEKVSGLRENLAKHIIGQDEAIDLVAAAMKRSRVQISPRKRPASFIFVGPTGVGKTELVKVLASELFDTVDPLIRLDMSEFMEKHAVSRIIGAPPGYVGYDEAGQLTEKVRRKPYSVILFDEIEKAHPDVLNILLQILDEGKVTDAHGRTVSFQNTVIVMTSNAGSNLRESSLGFNKTEGEMARDKVMKALSDFLRPEFLSRVDEIVVFNPLKEADYEKIAALMLEELREPLETKGISLSYDDKALSVLAKKAMGGKHSARDLRRIIRRQVEDPIANLLVDHYREPKKAISISANGEEISVIGL